MNVLLRIFGQLNRYRGSAAIVFLLAASGTLLVLVVPGASRRIIDEAIPSGDASQILPLALIAIAAIVARQGLFTLRTLVNNSFEQRMAHDRRVQVYDKLQRLPMGWFDSKSTGDVLSRVSADVPAMQRVVLEGIDQGMTAILQIVIVVAYLFWLQPSLAGLMIVPIPIIFASIAWYTRRADPRATEASTAAGGVQSVLGDSLGGVRQIKVFAVEHKQLELFRASSMRLRTAAMSLVKLNAVIWPGVSLLTEGWMVLTIALSASWIIGGTMTLGTLTAALLLWGLLYEPVGRLPPIVATTTSGIAAARRVFEILDQDDEVDLDIGLQPDRFDGAIEFRDVQFSYQAGKPVLSGLSLIAEPGQTVALVGTTGGGKTTVLNLLTRFHDIGGGQLLLDERPIEAYAKRHLRRSIGYVTQESFLFDTTIAENLRLAKHDASDDELWAALQAAEAESFVRHLDDGLNARVGERGSRLSGGQRQRLSIARVLVKDPAILLLDEATSAIDNQTERSIQVALERLRQNRTTLVIAHRLSTVRSADQIYVLDAGRVIQHGTHDEMIATPGAYQRLAQDLIES